MTKEFATDDNLAFAINQAISDLQNIVKDLPQGATNADMKDCISKVDTVVYSLISSVDDIEREIVKDEKGSNYIEKLIDDTNNNFKLPDMRIFASQLFGVCNQRKE